MGMCFFTIGLVMGIAIGWLIAIPKEEVDQ